MEQEKGALMNYTIADNTKIGKDTTIGHYSVIEKDVIIGRNCHIGHHVVIHEGTIIGDNVRIDAFSVLGKKPMRAKRSIFKDEDLPSATVGDDCLIGAHVVVYTGSSLANNILIADGAAVREKVSVGEYTIIGRNATIENLTTIGKKCKLETNCYITAYSEIGDYCFIAPGVHTTNDNFLGRTKERFKHFKGVTVKRGGRIGGHATILPGRVIGEDAVVGAGSVVTRDVPARKTVVGSPAQVVKDVPEAQLLENQDWD